MHSEDLLLWYPPEPRMGRVDAAVPVIPPEDGCDVRYCLEDMFGQIFDPLAIGNILADHQENRLLLYQHRFAGFADPQYRSVLAVLARFPDYRLTEPFKTKRSIALHCGPVGFVKHVLYGTVHQLTNRVAQSVGAMRVHGQHGTGAVQQEIHRRIMFEDRSPLLLAVAQRGSSGRHS